MNLNQVKIMIEKWKDPLWRKKVLDSRKKYKMSEAHKESISLALRGRKTWNTGKKSVQVYTQERNKRISESTKGQKHWNYGKKASRRFMEMRRSQIFPKKDSSIEVKIQGFLSQLGIEYYTHKYMNIEHGYQCDIFIPSKNLVIECFGDYWHKIPYGREIDVIRCQELRAKGYKVLVFWEREIRAMELNDLRIKLK